MHKKSYRAVTSDGSMGVSLFYNNLRHILEMNLDKILDKRYIHDRESFISGVMKDVQSEFGDQLRALFYGGRLGSIGGHCRECGELLTERNTDEASADIGLCNRCRDRVFEEEDKELGDEF